MKKNQWFEKLIFILLCILFSPFIILCFIVYFFQSIVPAPLENKKYKQSKYYEVYKRKYKIGITKEPHFLLQNELLENNIHLEEIRKPYGYMCLVDDYSCFALFDIEDLKLNDGHFLIQVHENSQCISIDDFVEDERKYFEEECINRKFYILIWREDEKDYSDILSNRENNLLLQKKGVYFYLDDELVKIVKELIANE